MKRLFLLAILSPVFFACRKDKGDAAPPATIDGYWLGTFTMKNRPGQNDIAVVLRDNGTARILYGYTNNDTATARYVSEDHFTYDEGTVQFQSRESDYTYSYLGEAKGNTMSGTWGQLPSYDDGGTWTLNKQ